jgi:transcriptional regulator with XRE-family HTH domain
MTTGEEIRHARESLGITRRELSDMIGLTQSQIAGVEARGPKPEQEEYFVELLQKAGVNGTDPAAEVAAMIDEVHGLPKPPEPDPAVDDFDTGRQVLHEYRGIKRGDVVRIDGEIGKRFKFGYYFKSPTQEYVGVYARNSNERCFRPERLRDQRGRVPQNREG